MPFFDAKDPNGDPKILLVDSSGNLKVTTTGGSAATVQGTQANGATPITENPVLVAGSDGTNVRTVATDSSGDVKVVGPDASGAAITGNPVLAGINDGGGLIRPMAGVNQANGNTGNGVPMVSPGLWDATGTVFRKCQGDGSGRLITVGAAAGGSAIVGAPVLIAGWDGVNAQIPVMQTPSDSVGGSVGTLKTQAAFLVWNGSTFERQRANFDVVLLASASQTTTQTSADITTYNLRGITVIVDVTVPGTGSITLSVNGKDPASGKYYALLTGAAITTVSTNVYRIQPGLVAVANKDVGAYLPRTIQIVVTANNANAVTYSVGYTLHN